jgi:hypothetical protein
MTVPTAADDPVRAAVEQWMRAFVDAARAVPAAAMDRVGRCMGGRVGQVADRVAEPVHLVRSFLELVTGSQRNASGEGVSATTVPDEPPGGTDAEPESPAAHQLPIDEYESLAASHVVDRLTNLTPDELREVQQFEVAHRARRTVLGRIDQLLGSTTAT